MAFALRITGYRIDQPIELEKRLLDVVSRGGDGARALRGAVKVCMRPTIKRISTIDGDDPVKYTPGDPDRFAIGLRLFVAPSSSGLGAISLRYC